ncbi:MAG: J domain-containing protein [Myxococcota bacterium]|nr:J domain-containing protein [Myxococcota bacterium]
MTVDLYRVLGLTQTATQVEIKKAYREIARKYHPDKNPGDEAAANLFSAAAEAYRILGDVELRSQYDLHGLKAAVSARTAAQSPKREPENPADVFRDIFGSNSRAGSTQRTSSGGRPRAGPTGRPPRRESASRENSSPHVKNRVSGRDYDSFRSRAARVPKSERGDDLRFNLDLRLEELAFGCDKTISLERKDRCRTCGGTGAKPGSAPVICKECGGSGEKLDEAGFFSTRKPCEACDATGSIVAEACLTCAGEGVVSQRVAIEVNVPAGMEVGTRLRIKGEGELGRGGGTRGDLFVVIQMTPHPFFRRDGSDILVDVPMRFDQAALGSTVEVPTLDGRIRMKVPAGSQSGREFRLKGKGLPLAEGRGRGDQRVKVIVEVPTHLTEEQSRLLERFGQLDEEYAKNPLVRDYLRTMNDYFSG